MPKYRGEHDPHGDPSMREIQEEEQRLSRVRAEVAELFYSLDVRNFDAEWSAPPHPDDLVDRVSELRKELIDIPIDDQVQSLLDRLDTVEKRVPLAYVHYLIRQVYRYGYRLNTAKGSYSRIEPLREELEQAREEIESAELGFEGQDAIDVLLEEEGWLDCYEKDPAMYKVRRACQELDKEIPKWTFVEDQQLDNAHLSLSGEVREEQYEWWEEGSVNHVAAVRALIEEAEQARDKVNDDEMKRYAQEYTQRFIRAAQEYLFVQEVPLTYVHLLGEYLALEAQMQAGESVDHQQQKDIVDRINELYNHVQRLKQKFGQKIIEAVESLRQQARRLGDPQQEGQRTMSDGWRRQTAKLALELFGFSDIPTKAELKKRRNDLARAHHPDVATDQSDATELMQQVNKAFDVLNGLLDDR